MDPGAIKNDVKIILNSRLKVQKGGLEIAGKKFFFLKLIFTLQLEFPRSNKWSRVYLLYTVWLQLEVFYLIAAGQRGLGTHIHPQRYNHVCVCVLICSNSCNAAIRHFIFVSSSMSQVFIYFQNHVDIRVQIFKRPEIKNKKNVLEYFLFCLQAKF